MIQAISGAALGLVIIIEHYSGRTICRLKLIKILKQPLLNVPIPSVVGMFKVFSSGTNDTSTCLL